MRRLDAPVLLAADVHLSAAVPARTEKFLAFLRGPARRAGTLCLLGDLFDSWTGDDDASPLATEIRAALRELSGTGTVRILMVRGNRDFLLGARFGRESGCEVAESDSVAAEIHGAKFLLAHGDHLLDDASYLRYRGWVRSGFFSALAASLPGGLRMRIAAAMRSVSRGGKKKETGPFRLNLPLAERELRARGCATLIHGHFHRRLDEQWQGGDDGGGGGIRFRRICLPDWTGESGAAGYAEADESGAICLRDWE